MRSRREQRDRGLDVHGLLEGQERVRDEREAERRGVQADVVLLVHFRDTRHGGAEKRYLDVGSESARLGRGSDIVPEAREHGLDVRDRDSPREDRLLLRTLRRRRRVEEHRSCGDFARVQRHGLEHPPVAHSLKDVVGGRGAARHARRDVEAAPEGVEDTRAAERVLRVENASGVDAVEVAVAHRPPNARAQRLRRHDVDGPEPEDDGVLPVGAVDHAHVREHVVVGRAKLCGRDLEVAQDVDVVGLAEQLAGSQEPSGRTNRLLRALLEHADGRMADDERRGVEAVHDLEPSLHHRRDVLWRGTVELILGALLAPRQDDRQVLKRGASEKRDVARHEERDLVVGIHRSVDALEPDVGEDHDAQLPARRKLGDHAVKARAVVAGERLQRELRA